MGFFSRLLIPRTARRAAHPVRTVKRKATPKTVKRIQRSMHPVSNAKYSMERQVSTAIRNAGRTSSGAPIYRHGNCPVKHRSPEAAAKCRNR